MHHHMPLIRCTKAAGIGITYMTHGTADFTRKPERERERERERHAEPQKETRSSDEEESEYSDVDVDSSGSEEVSPRQDIETGTSGKRNKKRTPKKKKTKELSKTPPLDKSSFSAMPLLQYVGIRVLQWILVIVSFATLSNSKVWVDIKRHLKLTPTTNWYRPRRLTISLPITTILPLLQNFVTTKF